MLVGHQLKLCDAMVADLWKRWPSISASRFLITCPPFLDLNVVLTLWDLASSRDVLALQNHGDMTIEKQAISALTHSIHEGKNHGLA